MRRRPNKLDFRRNALYICSVMMFLSITEIFFGCTTPPPPHRRPTGATSRRSALTVDSGRRPVEAKHVQSTTEERVPSNLDRQPHMEGAQRTLRERRSASEPVVWPPLSTAERNVADAVLRNPKDANALLRLALWLSGLDSEQAVRSTIDDFDHFVSRAQQDVPSAARSVQDAFLLFKRFHSDILKNRPASELNNYERGQAKIDVAMSTGTYNCFSSSIIFGLICMRFGLDVKAVFLREHVFLQIGHPSWAHDVEVETTSATGFDWIHDEIFYAERAAAWYGRRGLAPTSYADYKDRKVLPLAALVSSIAWNGDVHADVLGDLRGTTRVQVGYLVSPEPSFVNLRLSALLAVVQWVAATDSPTEATRAIDALGPELDRLCAAPPGDGDARRTLAWLASRLAVLSSDHAPAQIESIVRSSACALAMVPAGVPDRSGLESNVRYAVSKCTEKLLAADRFDEVARLRTLVAERLPEGLASGADAVDVRSGYRFFERKEWNRAVDAFRRCSLNSEGPTQDSCRKNLEAAYLNWASEAEREGNWPIAFERLQRCERDSPGRSECSARMSYLKSRHRALP